MKYDLAESILKEIMPHWDVNMLRDELNDIQVISEIKYDDYHQYTHGMRYIESLALWLRQFETPEEKDAAYRFVKNKLIYISEEEMRQLVEFSFNIAMKPYLIYKTHTYCESQDILDRKNRSTVFKYLRRKTLFLGLSDGAHIDFFRRHNPMLSNEQVFVHYDFSRKKLEDMLKSLRTDVEKLSEYDEIKEESLSFDTVFLIDDFSASGRSYIRHDEEGWHGKIHKFFEQLKEFEYDTANISIHVILYLSTQRAVNYIQEQLKNYSENHLQDKKVSITIDAIQIIEPLDCVSEVELDELLRNNYETNLAKGLKSFEDSHFSVGQGKYPYRGFSDCSLPLVLYHNTPNNSFPILWYSWEDNVNALFPRVSRHKEA